MRFVPKLARKCMMHRCSSSVLIADIELAKCSSHKVIKSEAEIYRLREVVILEGAGR
jgi:hypothetical protein